MVTLIAPASAKSLRWARRRLIFFVFQMNNHEQPAYKILVVDDESEICRALMMLLECDGHRVKTASGGEAALASFAAYPFDIVFTDYSMPDMKGNELATRIKQLRPGQPVIMVTAFADEFQKSGELAAAVDALVLKPFSLADLRAAVAKVMP
jgi:CheY-like chemotaxis protein